jgi:A/G-specific adenine glycosylase
MLQQTQTSRVEEKFRGFIAAFPDFAALAAASLQDVLRVWQGMGYNRRALYLKEAAVTVVGKYGGVLPPSVEQLEQLPGIGPATARSIAAYAFNLPVVFIETNIRTVYIHEFCDCRSNISDAELYPLVEQTLDRKNPWKWYNALMDYGVMLKEKHGNLSRRSAHYKKQSSFMGSDRRIRGAIVRCITRAGALSARELSRECAFPPERTEKCLTALLKDGLLRKKSNKYHIP